MIIMYCILLLSSHTLISASNQSHALIREPAQPHSRSTVPMHQSLIMDTLITCLAKPHIAENMPTNLCKLICEYSVKDGHVEIATHNEPLICNQRGRHVIELAHNNLFIISLREAHFLDLATQQPTRTQLPKAPRLTNALIPLTGNYAVHDFGSNIDVCDLSDNQYKTIRTLSIPNVCPAHPAAAQRPRPHHLCAIDNARIAALVYCFMGCNGGHNGQLVEWDTNNVAPYSITTLPPITDPYALAYLRNHRLFAIAVREKAVLEARRIGDVRRETHISLINAVTKKEVRQFPIGLTSIFDYMQLIPYRTHHLIVTRQDPPSATFFDIRNGSATASLQLPEPLTGISNTIACPDNSLYINYYANISRGLPSYHMKYDAPAIPYEDACTEECAEMVETKETKKSIFHSALCT